MVGGVRTPKSGFNLTPKPTAVDLRKISDLLRNISDLRKISDFQLRKIDEKVQKTMRNISEFSLRGMQADSEKSLSKTEKNLS